MSQESVQDIMTKDTLTVSQDSSVLDAAAIISPFGYLIVMKDGHAIGIVTEQDIVLNVTARNADPSKVSVKDIMSSPIRSVMANASVKDAADTMTKCKFRRLAVTNDDGAFVGMITMEDLAKLLAKKGNFQDPTLDALSEPWFSSDDQDPDPPY